MAETKHPAYTKFKCWMTENGVTNEDIGKIIGKSRFGVSQRINGTGPDFSAEEVRKICLRYGISADAFFVANKVS